MESVVKISVDISEYVVSSTNVHDNVSKIAFKFILVTCYFHVLSQKLIFLLILRRILIRIIWTLIVWFWLIWVCICYSISGRPYWRQRVNSKFFLLLIYLTFEHFFIVMLLFEFCYIFCRFCLLLHFILSIFVLLFYNVLLFLGLLLVIIVAITVWIEVAFWVFIIWRGTSILISLLIIGVISTWRMVSFVAWLLCWLDKAKRLTISLCCSVLLVRPFL